MINTSSSSLTNNGTKPDQSILPEAYYANREDDIDLKELFITLWEGKWTIFISTALISMLSIAYAWTTPEQWSSHAKVALPHAQDYSEYKAQVTSLKPLFDTYIDDGTIVVDEDLEALIDPYELIVLFEQEFSSNANKQAFFTSHSYQVNESNQNEDHRVNANILIEHEKLTNAEIQARIEISEYDLTVQTASNVLSFQILSDYMSFIANRSRLIALHNLKLSIDSKIQELERQYNVLNTQAQLELADEITRTEYAYNIAKKAGVDRPIPSFGDKELFAINLGSNVLEEKINTLKSIKDLSFLEPDLQKIKAKLSLLKTVKIDDNLQFKTVSYVQEPSTSSTLDKPKRALITVLGILLGGMLGAAIVLIRFAFRKQGDCS